MQEKRLEKLELTRKFEVVDFEKLRKGGRDGSRVRDRPQITF